MIEVKIVENYKDYGKCVSISCKNIEALVTVDIGPRIIRYAFKGAENILNDCRKDFSPSSDDIYREKFGKDKNWINFGGHRFWIAPEKYPDTYYPDSLPVNWENLPDGAVFNPNPQSENGLQTSVTVTMDENGSLTVRHTVVNISDGVKRLAPWAISVSAKGGTEIIPMNQDDTWPLCNNALAIWPYTDLRDERIYLGKKYTTIQQKDIPSPLKLGFKSSIGSVYYVTEGSVCRISYDPVFPNGDYPDFGMSLETYSCETFTEVETIGELKNLQPGDSTDHTEHWSLFKKPCDFDRLNEDSIDSFLAKL